MFRGSGRLHNTVWASLLGFLLLSGCSEDSRGCDDDSESDTGDSESDTVSDTGSDSDTGSEIATESDTGTETQSDTDFVCDCDEVWLDTNTELCWENQAELQHSTFLSVEAYCDSLVLCGSSEWRMPRIQELVSLTWGCVGGEQLDGGSECGVHDPDCLGVGCNSGPECAACPELEGPADAGVYWNSNLLGPCDDRYWSGSHWNNDPESTEYWFTDFQSSYFESQPMYPNVGYVRCVTTGLAEE